MTKFKHEIGSIVELQDGTLGRITGAEIMYTLSTGKGESMTTNEADIITEAKPKRERRKKEKVEETN